MRVNDGIFCAGGQCTIGYSAQGEPIVSGRGDTCFFFPHRWCGSLYDLELVEADMDVFGCALVAFNEDGGELVAAIISDGGRVSSEQTAIG